MRALSGRATNGRLTPHQVGNLDPYQFFAELGKKVIHPGGRRSTEELFRLAKIQPGDRVLEIGCGVGTTAAEIVNRFGAQVTAVDIDPRMVERATFELARLGLEDRVQLEVADVCELPFPDSSFDIVIAEAVTMFVDRSRAVREMLRVCRPQGRVLDHEFIWRKPPTPEARDAFQGEVCPGIAFESADDWEQLYRRAGVADIEMIAGPFSMMSPLGMIRDEGVLGVASIFARSLTRLSYLRKMYWLMPRVAKSWPYLGYVVLRAVKSQVTEGRREALDTSLAAS